MDAEKRQGGWQTRRLAWLSWACRSLANIVGRQVARLDTQDCDARESASKAVRSERRSATFPEKDPQTRGADTRVCPQTRSILATRVCLQTYASLRCCPNKTTFLSAPCWPKSSRLLASSQPCTFFEGSRVQLPTTKRHGRPPPSQADTDRRTTAIYSGPPPANYRPTRATDSQFDCARSSIAAGAQARLLAAAGAISTVEQGAHHVHLHATKWADELWPR